MTCSHHGISGPATLRLSAFAAREFNAMEYKCDVEIHFCPKWEEEKRLDGMKGSSEDILLDELWKMTHMIPKRKISTGCPLFMKTPMSDENAPIIPKRLWQALVHHSSIAQDLTWADASKAAIRTLSTSISSFRLPVTDKGTFKEEFVTAGGIDLKEVQMTTMESKCAPGLFMCGEVLDVDGVTGGFNFMGCWSTGFVAGEGAAEFCIEKNRVYGIQESLN
jgi:predicted flavoprotein YhiN